MCECLNASADVYTMQSNRVLTVIHVHTLLNIYKRYSAEFLSTLRLCIWWVTLYTSPTLWLQLTNLIIYTSGYVYWAFLTSKTQQDTELGNKFKFIFWSCGTKRMVFGFNEMLVKMTKLCLEDEVIVRQVFFFFTVTQFDSLFCRLFWSLTGF